MYEYLGGGGLPTWKISYNDNGVNNLTKQVAKMCEKATAYVLFGDTAIDAKYVSTYLEYIEKLLTGTMNGDAFIKGLAKEIK